MANQQVIISVLADVSKFSNRMRGLAGRFTNFAKVAVGATILVGAALGKMALDTVKAAESAKVANDRLDNIAESMQLFGDQARVVSKRLQDYASAQQFATGVDDETIKATQAKLLTFKELAKTAGTVGGAFDRATNAALDLAAAGFGSAESNAVQLGKALQDPVKGITALARAGVTFTASEKKKIKALVDSGKLLEAQNVILGAIETQVGGTAEATVTASQKMTIAFDEISETIGNALLPYVGQLAEAFVKWLQDDKTIAFFEDLQSVIETFFTAFKNAWEQEGVQDVFKKLGDQVQAFLDYLNSPEGRQDIQDFANFFVGLFSNMAETAGEVATAVGKILTPIKRLSDWLNKPENKKLRDFLFGDYDQMSKRIQNYVNSVKGVTPTPTPTIPAPSFAPVSPSRAPVTVNVTGITPTATIGRTVLEAVNTANRLGVR